MPRLEYWKFIVNRKFSLPFFTYIYTQHRENIFAELIKDQRRKWFSFLLFFLLTRFPFTLLFYFVFWKQSEWNGKKNFNSRCSVDDDTVCMVLVLYYLSTMIIHPCRIITNFWNHREILFLCFCRASFVITWCYFTSFSIELRKWDWNYFWSFFVVILSRDGRMIDQNEKLGSINLVCV